MEIVSPVVQHYTEKYTTPDHALLEELARYTEEHHPHAHMLSGHLQGKLLTLISHMVRPFRILEVGTFTGYSALCLAEGLAEGGLLHTIEKRATDAAWAKRYFDRSENGKKIQLHIGDASEIIGELDETWDLAFIDADKENYIHYFNLIFPKLRPNGFILADNVLFHGQVLEAEIKGKNARSIQAFNDFVFSRNDVEKLMIPIRDGLYLIRKK